MTGPVSRPEDGIARLRGEPGEHSFEALRRHGIRWIQELSGKTWTDFNVHDPGVTILEHLCYGLTDLIFRADSPVEDLLVDEDGSLDFEGLALHPPEAVFPCRPTTTSDLRKAIVDAVPEIEDVWISKAAEGLYELAILPRADVEEASPAELFAVAASVAAQYRKMRNLCEDVVEPVRIVEPADCRLVAEIELQGPRPVAEVLAEVYWRCARHVAGGLRFHRFEDVVASGISPERALRGPISAHGVIGSEETDREETVYVSDLVAIVRAVGGVRKVKKLLLEDATGALHTDSLRRRDPDGGKCLRLRVPRAGRESRITLFRNGRRVPSTAGDLSGRFEELSFKERAIRRTAGEVTALASPPRGRFRSPDRYHSIQNHFPAVYGIGIHGAVDRPPETDESLPDEERRRDRRAARATQLKSYLLLFEQMFANFASNVGRIPRLFSAVHDDGRTYSVQVLGNETIPGIEDVYVHPREEMEWILGEAMGAFDDHARRKGRLLDHLLALHGESFRQHSLRLFNHYYSDDELESVVTRNKKAFLQDIVAMGRDRAAAFDYSRPLGEEDDLSGIERRVGLLLGFPRHRARRFLTAPISGFRVVTRREVERETDLELLYDGEIDARFRGIPLNRGPVREQLEVPPEVAGLGPLQGGLVSDEMLRGGIVPNRYRLGRFPGEDEHRLVFRQDDGRWCVLGRFPRPIDAVRSASALCRFLTELNLQSEGIHVIEHVLLRDAARSASARSERAYAVSAVFPAWSSRCRDEGFRRLAEETVRLNCPAHVEPRFLWLDLKEMRGFERRLRRWLDTLRGEDGGPHEREEAAFEVAEVLGLAG